MPDRAALNSASTTDNAGKSNSSCDEKGAECPENKARITIQNTYRLESKQPFDRDRVSVLLEQIMREMMATAQYEPEASCKLAEKVVTEILTCVKELNFDRYRIIALVSIYEKVFQGFVSRCNALWDDQRDDVVSCTLETNSFIAVGTVFGVYYD